MIDTQLALEAQANIAWIADHWDDLTARLTPGSGAATSEVRAPSPEPVLPIDAFVSDLMAEIDWRVASHYCHMLADETDDVRSVPTTPEGRLRLVAERFGHFTMGDDRTALTFCDDAADYRGRVEKALERPPAPEYLGPCPISGCTGEFYVRGSSSAIRCMECLTETTREDQRAWVGAQMDGRLMTIAELGIALKVIGNPVPPGTLRRWASGDDPKLKPVEDGLYRLISALELAEKRRRVTA